MTDVRKIAAWVPVSKVIATDAALTRSMVDELFDRWSHPWKYPDRNPLPDFVPFPLLARLEAWLRRDNDEDDW